MSDAAKPAQSLNDAVLTQVEFYLSNSNLPFDKFLFGQWANSFHDPAAIIAKTPAPADSPKHPQSSHNAFHLGWLPLEKLASFKRMQPYLSAPPEGLGSIDAIADVVKTSSLVEVHKFGDEGETGAGWYVRRKTPLQKPEDAMQRSVYVKGFPKTEKDGENDEERKAIKAQEDELQKKLEQWARDLNLGKVLSVRMRREDKPGVEGKAPLKGKGKFKGSIFMEFADKSSVDKFLALDPKPTFEGVELETKSKLDYVEEKRKLYAPDSAPITGKDAVPKNPYSRSAKPFNAWAEKLVGENGFPSPYTAGGSARPKESNGKKRAAEDKDAVEEREIQYEGVRFKARRTGGKDGQVEIVDEGTIGTGAGEWPMGKVLRFTITKKDGSTSGDLEGGENFDFGALKKRLEPIAKPGFVSLLEDRKIAPLPSADKDKEMKDDPFPARATAPPEVKAAASSEEKEEDKPAEASTSSAQQYPARGQASFKEVLPDEVFEKIKSEVGEINGRKVEWVRISEAEERKHQISRARFHANQAFSQEAGGRGGRGGRGGGRGGRGGRGGGGRGGGNKRQRRD